MRNGLFLIFCICFFTLYSAVLSAQTCNPATIPASTPDSQLLDNGNGTVEDTKTGLVWKKCVEGVTGNACDSGSPMTLNWQQALERSGIVNSNGFAGNSDWRLPNIKELRSIVEEQCYSPAINLNRFPNTQSSGFWSGSPNAYGLYYAWFVHFAYGCSYSGDRDASFQVRLVRGGQ